MAPATWRPRRSSAISSFSSSCGTSSTTTAASCFASSGQGLKGRHYEIQLHDVEGAHYPTGSLYGFKRSVYPKIEPEVWFPFHLRVEGKNCMVRINGDTVLEYDRLETLDEGNIELQAHAPGMWTEFKQIRVKRLG